MFNRQFFEDFDEIKLDVERDGLMNLPKLQKSHNFVSVSTVRIPKNWTDLKVTPIDAILNCPFVNNED